MKKSAIRREYTAVDLFSGCGGLSLGLRKAGFVVGAAVEVDPIAAYAYRKNHPRTILLEKDIREVQASDLLRAAKLGKRTLDLLAGCPPCQGFSRIKRRNKKGVRDPRNGLVEEFLRIALEIRPRLILLENVPGLAASYRFKMFRRKLMASGYSCDWSILDAADFNVPQRRKRLILVASRIGKIEVPKNGNDDLKTVRMAIGKLRSPRNTKDPLHAMYLRNSRRIKQLIMKIPHDGGSRRTLPPRWRLDCHKNTSGFRDVYGRMGWDAVAPTLTGGCFNPSKGRFLHPVRNRAITMREAACLQSFPKRYYFPAKCGLSAIARLIGDALPPAFAYHQAKHLVSYLQET